MQTEDNSSLDGSFDPKSKGHQTVEAVAVIDERLHIQKEVVESGGGVRLRKVVHREPINVTEPLALQTLEVKRVTINREVDSRIAIRYEGDVTIFPIVEERLITRKQLVLTEEIHLTRRQQVGQVTQQVTLRREEVIVERQDPATGEWSLIAQTADVESANGV